MNPMLQALGQAVSRPQNNVMNNNPMAMVQQFADFKRQMAGKNPQAMVNELLQSGKMTPQQFEDLKKQANSLASLLK